jgi:hypothetical protein
MTTKNHNASVLSTTRDKAAKKATVTGENTVVYKLKDDARNNELLATQTEFAIAPENEKVVFLAIIDRDGQYVD